MSADEQGQVQHLLESPVGGSLRLARPCLEAWYGIWRDAAGARRSWTEAHARYARWQRNASYRNLLPLRRVQCGVDAARFERLSQFLRHPSWEATNNGAERAGQAFRHGQGPHLTLRSVRSIDGLLKTGACVRREEQTTAVIPWHGRRLRGRHARRVAGGALAA